MPDITRRAVIAAPAILRAQPKRQRPNLLYLLADDHAGYVMGCDGNRDAVTPNLDNLASEGTRFARHFCNAPVCTPSRQSFLTAQMPHLSGVSVLTTPLSEDKPTVAKQLKQAGYATGVIGKMHFNRPGRPGLHGFDYCVTEDVLNREWRAAVKPRPVPSDIPTKPQWRPFKDPARVWLNADKLPYPRFAGEMKADYQASLAEKYLEENRDRQFALWVSFHEPHSPFDFPVEDRTRIDPKRFTPPRVGPEDGWQIPLIFRDLSEDEKRGIIAAYYTSTYFLDRSIGRVLQKLESLGLAENTLVVYHADHGYDLGHHGRFEKHCGYEQALRVPLLMRWPGRIRRGAVNEMTEHIDVPGTLLELLDAPALAVNHGRSLRAYLEGCRPESRDHIISNYYENEEAFVRTKRWKFIHGSGKRRRTDGYETDNPTPGRYQRLFDLEKDPGEFTNVAPRQPRLVAEMEKLILARFRATHPEAAQEPQRLSSGEAIDWYIRPRDAR